VSVERAEDFEWHERPEPELSVEQLQANLKSLAVHINVIAAPIAEDARDRHRKADEYLEAKREEYRKLEWRILNYSTGLVEVEPITEEIQEDKL
jgi:hypothetical protein